MCQCLYNTRFLSSLRVRFAHHNSHYDTLKVHKNCTQKEIRDSFVKLSKECHPDTQKDLTNPRNTTQFIKIMEAYRILSKINSRSCYDLSLERNEYSISGQNREPETWTIHPNVNPNPGPYYGLKGINKVSNMTIAGILFLFAALGTFVQVFIIRHSFTLRRDRLNEASMQAGVQHAKVRADAEKYGNRIQLERMVEKLFKSTER